MFFLSPSAEIQSRYSVFSTFLVLLGNSFKFGQFLKSIPVLKSSGPQLSHGHTYFSSALSFLCVMKHFIVLRKYFLEFSGFGTKIFNQLDHQFYRTGHIAFLISI